MTRRPMQVQMLVLLAACGDSAAGPTSSSTSVDPTTTSALPTTDGPATTGTAAPTSTSTSSPDGSTSATSGASTSNTSTPQTSASSSTGDISTTTDDSSTGDPVVPPPLCGNFIVDPDESCDDGNLDPGDGCTPVCQYDDSVTCGNGTIEPPERCDDGNLLPADGCEPTCNHTPGQLLWLRSYKSTGNSDEGLTVATDSKSHIIAGGQTFNTPMYPNRQAAWLRKYTQDGDTVWTQLHISGTDPNVGDSDHVRAVAIDSEDAIVVSGVATAMGEKSNIWVARYGFGSPLEWETTRDGPISPAFDEGFGVAVGPDDHVVAVGRLVKDGNIDFDWWLAKFAPSGALDWEMTLPEPTPAQARAVAIDSGGNIIVSGILNTNVYLGEAHIRCFAPDGSLVWDRLAIEEGAVNSVAIDPDDNILAAGHIGDLTTEVWIAKYSPDGDELWSLVQDTPFGPSAFSADGWGLAVDASGNVAVHTGHLGWLGKFDKDGDLLWDWYEEEDGEKANDVAFDKHGYIATIGTATPPPFYRTIYVRRFTP